MPHSCGMARRLGAMIVGLLFLDIMVAWTMSSTPSDGPASPATSTTMAVAAASTRPMPTSSTVTPPSARTTARPMATGPSIPVTGRVVDAAGKGVPNATVSVAQHVDLPPGLFGGLAAFVSGFSHMGTCLAAQAPAPLECRTSTSGTTTRDGSYSLRLPLSIDEGRQIGTFDISVVWTAISGARSPATFANNGIQAPDITMWQPGLSVNQGRASWHPLPHSLGEAQYRLALSRPDAFHDSRPMFSLIGGDDGVSFEHRLLEDIKATVVVQAEAGERTFWSPSAPAPGPGAPPTRGRPCTVAPDDGSAQPIEFAVCPMTDTDDFTRVGVRPDAHQVVIDLGATRMLDLAVVRGYPGEFFVDVSDDGSAWTELAGSQGAHGPTLDLTLAYAAQPRSGRFVRLRLESKSWSAYLVDGLAVW
jgi:hypothetical protein